MKLNDYRETDRPLLLLLATGCATGRLSEDALAVLGMRGWVVVEIKKRRRKKKRSVSWGTTRLGLRELRLFVSVQASER